ncbi:MurR/RpiR family transcriptional regulator [Celeribacter arenosi]|uniref:MurR/RpiR family transcriptional regulator n=1 Tax=Celeribacter arenosi TaxID=792649 RepID=UPI0031DC381D
MFVAFETRLSGKYADLSGALKAAADYVIDNPINTASRPLRRIAADSGVSPASFTRLSRVLGYDSFEQVREEMRTTLGRRVHKFADRAERLQLDHNLQDGGFFDAHLVACQTNLDQLGATIDADELEEVVDRLGEARRVVLKGVLGSTAVVEYTAYMANFAFDNWSMVSRMGASLGSGLTGLDARDALVIVSKPPFSRQAMKAAKFAADNGVYVVLITDSHSCPALKHADVHFIVPTDSPHFFSSYVATTFLMEVIVGLLVSRSGETARERIANVEEATRALTEVGDR